MQPLPPYHSSISPRHISITAPIKEAFQWTRWVLFDDFDIRKWFILGFCAFLANLGEGGSTHFSFNPGSGIDDDTAGLFPFQDAIDFVLEEPILIGIIGVSVFALILGLILLFTWLSSQGKFMFLDGIIHNRARITEPWKRFRKAGEDLFIVRMFLFVAGSILSLIVVLLGLAIAWSDIQVMVFGGAAIAGVIFGGVSLFMLFVVFLLVNALLTDFVVLLMYRHNLPTMPAIHWLRDRFLKGHVGSFILFYLMKLVMSIGIGLVILIGGCLTCCFLYCVAALPYIGSVLLLPVSIFMRSYDIFFFKQFGDEADLLPKSVGENELSL